MRGSIVLLVLSSSLLTSLSIKASEIDDDDNVLVLSDDNFESAIAANPDILVEFYAPWCGICKTLAPEYAKSEGSSARLAKLDATIHDKLAARFEVTGYPTLAFFRSGKSTPYTGSRDAQSIVSWIRKRTGQALVPIETVEVLKEFVMERDVYAIAYFENQESREAKAYKKAAAMVDYLPIGITSVVEVKEKLGFSDGDIAVIIKSEGNNEGFQGEYTVENIKRWNEITRIPLVTALNKDTSQSIFRGEIKNFILIAATSSDYHAVKEEFTDTAKKFRASACRETEANRWCGQWTMYSATTRYISVDPSDQWNASLMNNLLNKERRVSLMYALSLHEDGLKKFVTEFTDINAEKITSFNKRLIAGELKQYLKSEEVPFVYEDDCRPPPPVSVLIGSNFYKEIKNSGKSALVEFYAPGCRYCTQLEPIWEELGVKFAHSEKILIAKIDATQNEVEGIEIQGYPTIKFFPAGSDEVIDYNGGRTLEDFVKFVNEKTEKIDKWIKRDDL